MGLDFMIYIVGKGKLSGKTVDQAWEYIDNLQEAAYGRKCYEITRCLQINMIQGYSLIKKNIWDDLIADLKSGEQIIRNLNDVCCADSKTVSKRTYHKYCQAYINWYSETFGGTPTTDYDFSTGYMLNMLEADRKIQEAYKDDKEVWGFASY